MVPGTSGPVATSRLTADQGLGVLMASPADCMNIIPQARWDSYPFRAIAQACGVEYNKVLEFSDVVERGILVVQAADRLFADCTKGQRSAVVDLVYATLERLGRLPS